jgi:hypothetical protein
MVPVATYSLILPAIDLPTFGIACRSSRSNPDTSVGYPPTARAAFSYAHLELLAASDREQLGVLLEYC